MFGLLFIVSDKYGNGYADGYGYGLFFSDIEILNVLDAMSLSEIWGEYLLHPYSG